MSLGHFIVRHYRVGQRVKLTARGIEQGLQGRARTPTGIVVATHPIGLSVKVRRDGIKTVSEYACAFWEADPR